MNIISDNIIEHEGIKGMQWGYHNGIPNGKRKAGINGANINTQSNAEFVPNHSTNMKAIKEAYKDPYQMDRWFNIKTYDEYVKYMKDKKSHKYKQALEVQKYGDKIISDFFRFPN